MKTITEPNSIKEIPENVMLAIQEMFLCDSFDEEFMCFGKYYNDLKDCRFFMYSDEVGAEIAGINVKNGCYCVFVYQPGIDRLSKKYKSDYAKGLMLFHNVEECWLIEMEFDANAILNNIHAVLINRKDIEPERIDELYKIGEKGVDNRKRSFLVRNNQKKIYPNDSCPCGSGKKYKKCCGRCL